MEKFKQVLVTILKTLKRAFLNKGVLKWMVIFAIPVLLVVGGLLATYNYFLAELPPLTQLERITPKLVTNIYDMNGELAYEYFVERREWVPIDSIPKGVVHAVMATEDREFYNHWGMNVWAIPSAILESVTKGKKLRGASTLTQQLTKLLFLTPERSISRKIKEAMTAIRIEQTYTKEEILEFYLNEVYLSGGNYGFQAAGRFYFGHGLDSLSIPEYAVLAGMLQRPEAYRPDKHPKASLDRRNTVLFAMYDAGYISKEDYHRYIKEPITLAPKQEVRGSGLYFFEEIRKYMEKKYGEKSLYAEGVSVYSTLDPYIQAFADSVAKVHVETLRTQAKYTAVRKLGLVSKYNMKEKDIVANFDSVYALFKKDYLANDICDKQHKCKFPESNRYHKVEIAALLIENETGAIRAMVGGSDFNESKWNRTVQSLRQPGSSFKPIVYATAVDNGASPCDSVNDQPITIPGEKGNPTWRPHNSEKSFEGMMTLRRALYRSKNLPAVITGMKYGLDNVVNYARKFGIQKSPLTAVPSVCLGSIGATLMEMTSAYTVFPNGGTRIEPYMIEGIYDKKGETIEKNTKIEHEVIRPSTAYILVDMMKDVNTKGTAARVSASGFSHPSAGKTGTSNEYKDAWYIGYTKHYTMGVWVGFDSPESMGTGHSGGSDALPLWIAVMKELHKDLPHKSFPVPSGVVSRGICTYTGKVGGEYCTEKSYCLYTTGFAPTEVCDGNHFSVKAKSAEDASLFNGSGTVDSKNTSSSDTPAMF